MDMIRHAIETAKTIAKSSMAAVPLKRAAGGATPGDDDVTAYHGGAKAFDQFDPAHIGTGEGAQMMGHGLYFAEHKDVAKSYTPRDPAHEERMMGKYNAAQDRRNYPEMEVWERALLHHTPEEIRSHFSDPEYEPAQRAAAQRVAAWMEKNRPATGSLYTVKMPREMVDHMIDLDAPIEKQHPEVLRRIAADPVASKSLEYARQMKGKYGDSGHFLYNDIGDQIARHHGLPQDPMNGKQLQRLASLHLAKMGVYGNKYMDQGSRESGQGTRNFVVFPGAEHHVKIVKREGHAAGGSVDENGVPQFVPPKLQQTSIIKHPGGQWLAGSGDSTVDPLTQRVWSYQLNRQATPEEALEQHAKSIEDLKNNPYTSADKREQLVREFQHHLEIPTRHKAVNDWIGTTLKKYIQRDMGTEHDPVRALAERGILHYTPDTLHAAGGRERERASINFGDKVPHKPVGQSFLARAWEDAADTELTGRPAREFQSMNERQLGKENSWLHKLDPSEPVYGYNEPDVNALGFTHLRDELHTALTPSGGLPQNLQLRPESLKRMSVPQAVEHVHKINEWRKAQKAEADQKRATNAATFLHKDYPDSDHAWYEIRQPEGTKGMSTIGDLDEEDRGGNKALEDALKYEGEQMGHCVGGYADAVRAGNSRIFSLRNKKTGEPHVTIETGRKQSLSGDDLNGAEPGLFKKWQENRDGPHGEKLNMFEWLAKSRPEIYDRMCNTGHIEQIKGKGNRKPIDRYLPFVHDFVQSQDWDRVRDLHNTDLERYNGKYVPTADMDKIHDDLQSRFEALERVKKMRAMENGTDQHTEYDMRTSKDPETQSHYANTFDSNIHLPGGGRYNLNEIRMHLAYGRGDGDYNIDLARRGIEQLEKEQAGKPHKAGGGEVGAPNMDFSPPRQLTQQGLYSAAAEAARNLPQQRGTPQQMIASLKGVKPEEIARSGVHAKFAGQKSVTKDELAQHFEQSLPPLQEASGDAKFANWSTKGGENYRETLMHLPSQDPQWQIMNLGANAYRIRGPNGPVREIRSGQPRNFETREDAERHIRQLGGIPHESTNSQDYKSGHWDEPNVVAHLRMSDRQDLGDAGKPIRPPLPPKPDITNRPAYNSNREADAPDEIPAWSTKTPGLIVHKGIGSSEKKHYTVTHAASGQAVLRNVKSYWGAQKAAEKLGPHLDWTKPAEKVQEFYKDPANAAANTERREIFEGAQFRNAFNEPPEDLMAARREKAAKLAAKKGVRPPEKHLLLDELQSDWGQAGRKKGFMPTKEEIESRVTQDPETGYHEYGGTQHVTREEAVRFATELAKHSNHVPSGPYVTNTQHWTDLGLKRALFEAAKGNYDKLIWTPGQKHADRYNMSHHIGRIQYWPQQKQFFAYKPNGQHAMTRLNVEPDDLHDIVGHEIAEKLLKPENSMPRSHNGGSSTVHELAGQSLQLGGEGMKGYYDNIIPKRLLALAREHDPQAQLGHVKSSDKATNGFPGLTITPQMRESILKKGFKAYARGGEVNVDNALRVARAAGGKTKFSIMPPAESAGHDPIAPPAAESSAEPNINHLSAIMNAALAHHLSLPYAKRVANSKHASDTVARHMGVLQDGLPKPLLNKNAKMMKAELGYQGGKPIQIPDGRTVETTGLSLAPSYREGKFSTCPNSASCEKECLGKTSGNYFKLGGGKDLSEFKGPRLSSLRRTQAFLRNPGEFVVRLHDELTKAKRDAADRGSHLGVRLNVLSDIAPKAYKTLMEAHPDVSFYDYTKMNFDPIAPNHHYTYSSTGVSQPKGLNDNPHEVVNPHTNWHQVRRRLDGGDNVSMVFSHKRVLPQWVHDQETGKRYKVIDGLSHDFRPLDTLQRTNSTDPGFIVGLKNLKTTGAMEDAAKDSHGFFVHYDPKAKRTERGTLAKDEHGNEIPTNDTVHIAPQTRGRIKVGQS
jgi:hypothetical protein